MKKLLSILLIIGFLTGGVLSGYAAQPSQYVINAGDARWSTKLNAGLDALWDGKLENTQVSVDDGTYWWDVNGTINCTGLFVSGVPIATIVGRGLTFGGTINATGLSVNGVPVGTSTDTFWEANLTYPTAIKYSNPITVYPCLAVGAANHWWYPKYTIFAAPDAYTDMIGSEVRRGICAEVVDCTAASNTHAVTGIWSQVSDFIAGQGAGVTHSGTLVAGNFKAENLGNGTLTGLTGVGIQYGTYLYDNSATGTVTQAVGLSITGGKAPNSTITAGYGIKIFTTPGSTTSYDIYCGTTTANNYFAGDVSVGYASAPGATLHVEKQGVNLASGRKNFYSKALYTDLSGQTLVNAFYATVTPTSANTQETDNIYVSTTLAGNYNHGATKGVLSSITHSSTGAFTTASTRCFEASLANSSTGIITAASGFYVKTPTNASGTLTNTYGVYIESQTSAGTHTNVPYGIYQAGTQDRNFFGAPVGIGTANINASSILHLSSTTMGFLPPVMTTAQRDAISTPAEGLMVYNSTTHKLNVRVAAAWAEVTSAP